MDTASPTFKLPSLPTLAERIAWARRRKGWNQSQLARRMSTSPQAVQQWEKGGGCRQLEKLAKRLGVPAPWLAFGGAHESVDPDALVCDPSQAAIVARVDALEVALDALEQAVATVAPEV